MAKEMQVQGSGGSSREDRNTGNDLQQRAKYRRSELDYDPTDERPARIQRLVKQEHNEKAPVLQPAIQELLERECSHFESVEEARSWKRQLEKRSQEVQSWLKELSGFLATIGKNDARRADLIFQQNAAVGELHQISDKIIEAMQWLS